MQAPDSHKLKVWVISITGRFTVNLSLCISAVFSTINIKNMMHYPYVRPYTVKREYKLSEFEKGVMSQFQSIGVKISEDDYKKRKQEIFKGTKG